MAYNVKWSDFAENEIHKIFIYYCEHASITIAKKIIQKILDEPSRLINDPEISPREELLFDRENKYYYLVCDNYKLIYSVDKNLNHINITDVFDTRQNPLKIKRTK
ncbi:type II toxin-antitoxin system RelE/ParE family toxin [Flavobacterium sp. RHBU_24]|uniref:type II toxin-antitoxin system RelE/ParE family toxin n=1 Tax=Flavobacterium sp. RHBU_24 TaxID=3391185 RepID=UPI0039848F7A